VKLRVTPFNEPSFVTTVEEFAADNDGDDVADIARALKPGETAHLGGGATPEVVIEAIDDSCTCGACAECDAKPCEYCDGTVGEHQRGCESEGFCPDCFEDGLCPRCARHETETRLGL
jgi:hypothetical protein